MGSASASLAFLSDMQLFLAIVFLLSFSLSQPLTDLSQKHILVMGTEIGTSLVINLSCQVYIKGEGRYKEGETWQEKIMP